MIVIIDCGLGNLGSIRNMLKKIGSESVISSRAREIEEAEKLILPGVGSFDRGMSRLQELNLVPVLQKKVIEEKTAILGICLGMQLMTEQSEEGKIPGLGWFEGETVKFRMNPDQANLKVPHMGWNTVSTSSENGLFNGLGEEPRFYFVHSYHVVCENKEDELATTHHGYEFVSAVQRNHILGVQFHPEKSHQFGMALLKNFIERF